MQTLPLNQSPQTRARLWGGHSLALASGALTPLGLAPFDLWPLSLLTLALFAVSLQALSARQTLWRSFYFGLGLFGTGASWVYVSIHQFGNAPLLLAALLTLLFVAGLALVFCLPFYAYGRWCNRSHWGLWLAFPALWVLNEWLRSWLLTGFPWLYLGYGHIDTPLAGWAPLGGIFSLSFIHCLTAATLALLLLRPPRRLVLAALSLSASVWLAGALLTSQSWTQPKGDNISVGLVQANIPQALKWQPHFLQPTLDRYLGMSEELWQHDWLIWPEAAIPLTYHRAGDFLELANQRAQTSNTGLITGILYDDLQQRQYHNSAIGLGTALGIYHKQRLVPFGEYVPLENWLRGLIDFFNLPTSFISKGPDQQRGIQIGALSVAPLICYEVVYPILSAEAAKGADVLLTISNDAWFGASLGPLQHLQMAQMRALESGRYLIRATNNGISAIIDPRGQITKQSQQFVQQTLSGTITAMGGSTPFVRWGNTPILVLCSLLLAVAIYRPKHKKQHTKTR